MARPSRTGGKTGADQKVLVGEITAVVTYDVLGADWNLMFAQCRSRVP
jgi:hypothetical protein